MAGAFQRFTQRITRLFINENLYFAADSSLKIEEPAGTTTTLPASELLTMREPFKVGGVYISVDATNPADTLGYGVWEPFGTGAILIGQ